MKRNNFSLQVKGNTDNPTESDNGYVYMAHGETYSLFLMNANHLRCEAEVSIDGELVGVYRLSSTLTIERPPQSNKQFTFFASNTPEAQATQLGCVDKDKLGVVSVKFVPEKTKLTIAPSCLDEAYRGCVLIRPVCFDHDIYRGYETTKSSSSGGTGLSGHSDQQFQTVAGLDRDENNTTTLELRLIHDSSVEQKIEPLHNRNTVVKAPPPL